jgi:UDP-glucose 4-epimerase
MINGDGEQTRDFVYVEDGTANVLAVTTDLRGIYNVGTGIETPVNVLYAYVASMPARRRLPSWTPKGWGTAA